MGSSSHLKRLAIPRSWPLPRKTTIWVTRPRAGAHSLERCMPLNIVIRDVIGLARSTREVRTILHNSLAKVDGRVVKDTRRGIGVMDVLTLGEDNYRCVLDTNGRLRYRPISAEEAGWKVCRIEGKSTIKGGKTQVHLHDGRNIIVDDASEHKTGDSLKISLPEQKVIEHIKLVVFTLVSWLTSPISPLSVQVCLTKLNSKDSVQSLTMYSLSAIALYQVWR